jgi:hypothetical protein
MVKAAADYVRTSHPYWNRCTRAQRGAQRAQGELPRQPPQFRPHRRSAALRCGPAA